MRVVFIVTLRSCAVEEGKGERGVVDAESLALAGLSTMQLHMKQSGEAVSPLGRQDPDHKQYTVRDVVAAP